MKHFLSTLLFILITNPFFIKGQDTHNISAVIINGNDSIPMSYVNVMLYGQDSLFLNGTITNEEGRFSIENTQKRGKYLKLSSIGYSTQYILLHDIKEYITMHENTSVLSEVVVKGNRNFVKPTAQGLSVSMKNNPVAELGTAFDALSQMPLVDGSTGSLKVIGKGSPQIYINNKLVRDNTELSRLSAHDIEHIEIITNPGAKYASDVSSVIIIRTKKRNTGLGGEVMFTGTKAEVWSSRVGTSLNYKHENGINLFGEINYSDNGFRQKRTYNERFNENRSFTTTTGTHQSRAKTLNTALGSNYEFKENSIGIKYEFTRTPDRTYTADSYINTNVDAKEELISSNEENNQNYRHYVNAYLLLKIGEKATLSADADYIYGKSKHHTLSTEMQQQQTANEIRTGNRNSYHLGACKINANMPLWQGKLDFGGEYSYTESGQHFSASSSKETDLFKPSTDNKNQHFGALYLSYERSINNSLSCYAGIRYELTDFTYHQNETLIEEQSKKYNDVLPNAGISYSKKGYTINLYYKSNMSRPAYESLNSNYSYVSHTLWETGNPLLRASLDHSLGLNVSWKKVMLSAVYSRNKRNIYSIYEYLPKEKINIRKDVNLPDYNSYTFTAYTNLDFGFWHPMLQGFIQIQDLRYGSPSASYTKPIWQLYMSNRFDLPGKFYAYLNGVWLGKGHACTAYSEGGGMVNILLNKTFGDWSFNARANGILSSWRQKNRIHTNGILYDYNIKGASHSFILSVNYTFNAKKKTYKGTGAAKEEIKRL